MLYLFCSINVLICNHLFNHISHLTGVIREFSNTQYVKSVSICQNSEFVGKCTRYTVPLNLPPLGDVYNDGRTYSIPLRVHWSGLIVIIESIELAQHHLSAEPVEL